MDTRPHTHTLGRQKLEMQDCFDLKRKNCMRKKRYVVKRLCVCVC